MSTVLILLSDRDSHTGNKPAPCAQGLGRARKQVARYEYSPLGNGLHIGESYERETALSDDYHPNTPSPDR